MAAPTEATTSTELHVVLVEPEIPWNTGNAGRTCLAAGAELHLVEPLGFSLDEKRVRRAGLDYWSQVPLTRWKNWEAFEQRLPELGDAFFLSAEAPRPIWEAAFTERSVLVFGCETAGLPESIRDAYRDRLYAIPMQDDGPRSLNLSTSVGVVLYEALRQRRPG